MRFDSHLYAGYAVPPFYDSLLGKLVVWDETRGHALVRLRRALGEMRVEGVATTLPLHRRLAAAPDIDRYDVHTGWLESWLATDPPSTLSADTGRA